MTSTQDAVKFPGYIPRLQVLRAYAILLVFLIHFVMGAFGLVLWNGSFRNYAQWPYSYGLVPAMYGWAGVALFFVISGFCIHYAFLIMKPGSFRSGLFLWKRFARLYPAYLASLLFFIGYDYVRDPSLVTGWGIVSHLLLIHNLSPENFAGINGVYWSLGVECQFYLLYPLLLLALRKYRLPVCFAASLALGVVGNGLFSWRAPAAEFPVDVYRSFPLTLWCDWILGACLAEAYLTGRPCFVHKRFFFWLALGLFIGAENFRPLIGQAFLFASVGFAVLLQEYVARTDPLNGWERCLAFIGAVSYSLYLWHAPLIVPLRDGIHRLTGIPDQEEGLLLFVYLPLTFLLIFLVSVASYYLFEVRARQWLMNRSREASARYPSASLSTE